MQKRPDVSSSILALFLFFAHCFLPFFLESKGIAFTEHMMDPKPAFNNQYQFQKIYQELDYLAGGILDIPVGGRKDTKPAKDNSYVRFSLSLLETDIG